MTAQEAFARLGAHTRACYDPCIAAYSGDPRLLSRTGRPRSFWRRSGRQKLHMPLAAEIAATSSDLLFGEELILYMVDREERPRDDLQPRLEEILQHNSFHALLCEAAESCSALGDVYLKILWDRENGTCPCLRVVQGDRAWPEYVLGNLAAIHFFTPLEELPACGGEKTVVRLHERYSPGRIVTRMFRGSAQSLGMELGQEALEALGLLPEVEVPGGELLAVHIPNIRPNRLLRGSCMGRSDLEGQRDLLDALDEAYSSWMRDIRLGKARLLVPAEYLRRGPEELFDGTRTVPTFEFDEDVETLCALDVDTGRSSEGITPTQFSIRAEDHLKTWRDLIGRIVGGAGYAPQTFGLNIEGNAPSGTALRIRERRSFATTAKKQGYWQAALERLLGALVHLDARLYPGRGSEAECRVHLRFADLYASDVGQTAQTLSALVQARAVSTQVRVRMLHPDWTGEQVGQEEARIREEYGLGGIP